jgi:hypothetical protein
MEKQLMKMVWAKRVKTWAKKPRGIAIVVTNDTEMITRLVLGMVKKARVVEIPSASLPAFKMMNKERDRFDAVGEAGFDPTIYIVSLENAMANGAYELLARRANMVTEA